MPVLPRRLLPLCIGFAALLFGPPAPAQTVEEIMERHIEAIGGKEALDRIEDRIEVWRASPAPGEARSGPDLATFTLKTRRPDLFLLVASAEEEGEEEKVTLGFDGKKWWRSFSGGHFGGMTGEPMERGSSLPLSLAGLLRARSAGEVVRIEGKEEVDGHPTYVLKATPKKGEAVTFHVDAETYLVRKISAEMIADPDGDKERFEMRPLSRRVVEGVRIPDEFELKIGVTAPGREVGITLELDLEEVSFNSGLKEAEFSPPKDRKSEEEAPKKKGWY